MNDAQPVLTVSDDRVQRMIEWLRKHQEQIRLIEKGKLEIYFAGGMREREHVSIRVALTMNDVA